jgi:hypothetical protein
MDLSDNDLLDLHLARKSLDDLIASSPSLDCAEAREVLSMLKNQPLAEFKD